MTISSCLCVRVVLAILVGAFTCSIANAAVQVLGVQYQQDQLYPEFNCIWNDKTYPTSCPPRSLGCNVHVYVKNTGGGSVSITDVTLAGYSLNDVLVENAGVHYARSIYFNWDNPPTDIMDAGEPVWYKGDPTSIPAGGVGQAVIRLRSVPVTPTISVGVETSGGNVTTNITINPAAPVLASIGYSADLTKVYLHWRRAGGGAPTTIRMDGTNATAITTTVGDPAMNFASSVINLPAPIAPMSYHVFQGVYGDGAIASASQRAWTNKFIYASYGNFELDANYTAADWVAEAANHGFNNVQVNVGEVGGYMFTAGGQADCRAREYGYTTGDKTKFNPIDPDMFFLEDEPDAEEANMESTFCGTGLKLPCGKSPMGILVMREIAKGEELRALRPMTPTNVNLDGTFRPENYYAWGQAMDVTQVDPYYQRRLSDVYWRDQNRIPLYLKATYIYAVSKATVTAAEPNPANILTFSCEWKCDAEGKCDAEYVGQVWPFPTPAAKRIEIYYALAAGAKGLGYWWFPKGYPSNGLADQGKATARALWKELGLLGNEIKTVAPWLVTGHPVELPLSLSSNVWAKAIASRTDSLLLLVVNDNYYNDLAGCHYTPVPNASVTATLPSWLQGGGGPMAFEVTAGGLQAVATQLNGNQLQVNLGTLSLTKMIVLTKNPQTPVLIKQRYDQRVRAGVCSFASELCGNAAPSVVVPPQSQSVVAGANASFYVAASGTPSPGYQWRFGGVNLAGATGDSYTRVSAQEAHAGGYSVVVSNSFGSVTSVVATLTVTTNAGGVPPGIITPPASQIVSEGSNVLFSVVASGNEPLKYQWRFNDANLAGATDNSYIRVNAQTSHSGEYAVVVTNSFGAITSAATLTVTGPILCTAAGFVNGGFESTNGTGVAVGWTSYQRAPNPASVWSIQTALPPEVGSTYYQQIANTSSTGGGGVRQNITGCVIGATYQIAGWMRGNSALATCTVKCSPSASTSWATAVDLNPPQSVSTNAWTPFSGTVVATSTTMTLWLDGQTGGTGQNKAQCFDSVTVTCLGPTAPAAAPVLQFQQSGTNLVFRWPTNGSYELIATTNVNGSAWSGVLPAPSVVNGTNVVTHAITGERKFFRLMQQ